MSVYKRNGSPFWYFSFRIDGKRIEGSTKTTSKTLAGQIASTKKADFLRNKNEIKVVKKKVPFETLVKEFLAWSETYKDSYKRDLVLTDHLSQFFDKRDISDINKIDVGAYMKHRVKSVKGSTVNREIACLKRMYNMVMEGELIDYNPVVDKNPVKGVKFFKEPRKNFRWFPADEIEKFLKVSGSRMKSIFPVGINTGLRISELLSLKWSQIDFENDYITIEESKTDEYRKVKMNPVVIGVLKGLESKGDYVFSNHNGEPFQRINKAFKNVCK